MGKQNETRVQKVPKTIKVSTVVISIAVFAAIVTAFIGGWVARSNDMARVQSEANAIAQTQLKDAK